MIKISGIWTRKMAFLLVFAVVLAACGSDDDTSATSGAALDDAPATTAAADSLETSDEVATAERSAAQATSAPSDSGDDAMADADTAGSDGQELGSGGAPIGLTAAELGRDIIFTATIGVEVDDVEAGRQQADVIIGSVGGFVFGQNTTGGAEPRSEIIYKVRPDRFNEALNRLGEVGELRNQTITTDDVTERVVDLSGRIEVAELGVERLRNAMEGATDLEDFARLESLLLDREGDLEVMRGQLRTIQDRVDLATITLTLSQDRVRNSVSLTVTGYEGHDGGQSCPGQGDVQAEANTAVTLCFEVTNTGDQTLRNLAITDTVLEIDADTQLIVVFDDLGEIAPGQSALVAHEFTPERTVRPRPRVSGVPTNGVSDEAAGPAVSASIQFEVRTFEQETNPGFRDGFDTATNVLTALWVATTVAVGFLLPLLILLPLLWLAWKLIRPRVGIEEDLSGRTAEEV